MAVDAKTAQPTEYFRQFFEVDVRPDGRVLSEIRPITLNIGSIGTTEGSALVKLGNTTVLCGIKAELTTPKDDAPKCGIIVPNVDLPPICSPIFKRGPPTELAQAATVFMDDIIKCSQCVSLEDLCIVEGKLCWVLYCDMMCLDYDGNILDACSIALIAALKNTMLPTVEMSELQQPQTSLKKKQHLKVAGCPVSTTFAMFNDKIMLVDPTQEEEGVVEGFISIVTDNDEVHIVNKPGGSLISSQQLQMCIRQAKSHTKEVMRLIEETMLNVER